MQAIAGLSLRGFSPFAGLADDKAAVQHATATQAVQTPSSATVALAGNASPAARLQPADTVDISLSARALMGMTGSEADTFRSRLQTDARANDQGAYGLSRNQLSVRRDLAALEARFPSLGSGRAKAGEPADGTAQASETAGALAAGMLGASRAAPDTGKPDPNAKPGPPLPEGIDAVGRKSDEKNDRRFNADESREEDKETPGDNGQNEKDGQTRTVNGRELTKEETLQVEELKARDEEVRTHEQAHIAAGGPYVRGSASYDYQQGPDGKRYAIGGEVSIDASPEDDPADTVEKMRTVRAAALAPAEPSSQDRSVAAQAMMHENRARQEMSRQQRTENGKEKESGSETPEWPANAMDQQRPSMDANAGRDKTSAGSAVTATAAAESLSAREDSGVLFGGKTARIA